MIGKETDECIKELFEWLSRYQMGLEELRKSSNFVVICADLLYYKCYKISLKCGVLYIDSPNWIKKYKLIWW